MSSEARHPEPVRAARAGDAPATFSDVPYGRHFRQTMDVWLARSRKPTPALFYSHGGGWQAQDKTDIHEHLDVRRMWNTPTCRNS